MSSQREALFRILTTVDGWRVVLVKCGCYPTWARMWPRALAVSSVRRELMDGPCIAGPFLTADNDDKLLAGKGECTVGPATRRQTDRQTDRASFE